MGELEKDEVGNLLKYCAIKRLGKVEEIASLFAFCASDMNGYLTGVDILCDGGCVALGVILSRKVNQDTLYKGS
jgi:NAD(P)-dependent dehydrogenase (short-subunit alcohol dehydrogenase family)